MLPSVYKQRSTGFFEPAQQELDRTQIYPHQQSTLNLADGAVEVNIPNGVNCVLLQANTQSIRYTLSGTNPTAASGFLFTAGATPILLPLGKNSKLKLHAAANGAVVEMQFGAI